MSDDGASEDVVDAAVEALVVVAERAFGTPSQVRGRPGRARERVAGLVDSLVDCFDQLLGDVPDERARAVTYLAGSSLDEASDDEVAVARALLDVVYLVGGFDAAAVDAATTINLPSLYVDSEMELAELVR